MKALILDGAVVDMAADAFPVHDSMIWVDVPPGAEVARGWTYTAGAGFAPPPAPPPPTPPARWLVPKLTIVDRLIVAGLLESALAAIAAPENVAVKARWDAVANVWNDNPDALALLGAIGADAGAIMARDESG